MQNPEKETSLTGEVFLDIIKTYVTLDGNPDSPRGYCPLCHGDERSFVVRPGDGGWHCFNCGQGGDVYRFIEKLRRVSHSDAKRFVEILSQSSVSRVYTYKEEFRPRKKDDRGKEALSEVKAASPERAAESTAAKPAVKWTRRTKNDAADIGLVATKPPVSESGEPSRKQADDSLVVADTKTATARPDPQPTANSSQTEPQAAERNFVEDLLQKFDGQAGLHGLAVIAREEEGEMLGSSLSDLLKKDVEIMDGFAKEVVQASKKILGHYDGDRVDVLFSMDATYKAAQIKLIWVPVSREPFRCNVLLMLEEDARESVIMLKLRSFF
jgi:hypothetical protein